MSARMRSRRRLRRRSSLGQADVSRIILLASLCAAVFACFFFVGRAASSHRVVGEPARPTVEAFAGGVPVRLSSAPAIAPAIANRAHAPRLHALKTQPAVAVRATEVAAAATNAAPAQSAPTSTDGPHVTSNPGAPSSTSPTAAPTRTAPASSGGAGTSFDTSG
jgi:hypothetical protein